MMRLASVAYSLGLYGCLLVLPTIGPAVTRAAEPPAAASPALLAGAYEDPLQQAITFPNHSYYLLPWRAYLDTWPANRVMDTLGVNFNIPVDHPEWTEPTARLLALAGARSARIEMGWGQVQYENPKALRTGEQRHLQRMLSALRANGIRPLILLNANSGWPCPILPVQVTLAKPGAAGDHAIHLDIRDIPKVRIGFTGLKGQAYQVAYPLILTADSRSGACALSAPLNQPLPAGPLDLYTLRHKPFAEGTTLTDGTKLNDVWSTYDGWREFVATACGFVRDTLGTQGKADSGFDVEVWNEYTFGSEFLTGSYYQPQRQFKVPIAYQSHGASKEGVEIILPITVDYLADPANGFAGVNVISGFANQRPWDNGSDLWPGQAGFSRHYYTGINTGKWHSLAGHLSSQNEEARKKTWLAFDALGRPQAWPYFVPDVMVNLPEFWAMGFKGEYMIRDLQPFPSRFASHYRYSHTPAGQTAQVWMTEYNFNRQPWLESLTARAGIKAGDSRVPPLMEHLAAKALLRSLVFWSHKGVKTINYFATCRPVEELGLVPAGFYARLAPDAPMPSDDQLLTAGGRQMQVLHRLKSRLDQPGPAVTRPLSVASLAEHSPRLVFKGDGTAAHPDRYNRDVVAVLPLQLSAQSYAVGCYVMTLNLIQDWDVSAGVLDPKRYDMPPQTFDLKLENVAGRSARVSLWDPLTDKTSTPSILLRENSAITVRLELVDYPRFLMLDEGTTGPLILSPLLKRVSASAAQLTFATNLDGVATVTMGLPPERRSLGQHSLAVKRGVPTTLRIPALPTGSGVRIHFEKNGLKTIWPQWGHDTAGVLWPAGDLAKPTLLKAVPGTSLFPGLPGADADRPVSMELRLGEPDRQTVPWDKLKASPVSWTVPGGEIRLSVSPLPAGQAHQLLPPLAVSDQVVITPARWGAAQAWRVDIIMDATAHPGQPARHSLLIVPLRVGLAVLHATTASRPAAEVKREMERIKQAAAFTMPVPAKDK